jgi:type II secretory pathway pseudopilin PulG
MRQRMWQTRMRREDGFSLSGLIVVLVVLGFLAVMAMKIFPAWAEYRAIKNAIVAAKAAGGGTREIQQAFSRNADINDITSISAKDLVITRDKGEPELSFAYEKRIPVGGKVSLLIDFAGTTDPSGEVATKTDTAAK